MTAPAGGTGRRRPPRGRAGWLVPAFVAGLAAGAPGRALAQVDAVLAARLAEARATGAIATAGGPVAIDPLVLRVYDRAGGVPLWGPAALDALTQGLDGVAGDGLDPELYLVSALRARRGDAAAGTRAELDLLATEALVRAVGDLRRGRVRDSPDRGAAPPPPPDDPDALLAAVRGNLVAERIAASRPSHPVYGGLTSALARLRDVARSGGWETIPDGPALGPGDDGPGVPELRRRLLDRGGPRPEEPSRAGDGGEVFDGALESAVRAFQHRHGLREDGVVGPATRAALNVPVETRIDQVRVNLERARWVTHDLPDAFVVVNVAGALVYLVRRDRVEFETRAVVGRTATETPVFRASVERVELNPTWTVPPGIVDEVLSAARRDPGYLAREGMRVLDSRGRRVDPATLDLDRWTARTFPYVFRQDPGPRNPLGRIKLVLPNPYHVYLHDTPSRTLFDRDERTFSHGCVRVREPVALAARVLGDGWTAEGLEAAIAEGRTRTLSLPRPLPVLVLYWTAATDFRGTLHFHRDVYGRDAPLLAALDRPR